MLSKLRTSFKVGSKYLPAANFSTANADPGSFDLLRDLNVKDKTMPQFVVGTQNGFLPRQDPLDQLPSKFSKLEDLLQEMPLMLPNGSKGLLAKGEFGDRVLRDLPLYDISDIEDTHVLAGLFRDYTFVASSYLLEPCDLQFRKTGDYGHGRDTLPKNVSVPLWKLAQKIKSKPFMEYALSYALYNWARIDKKGPLSYENLKLVRAFEGGASEHGFIITHVTMVAYTGQLVDAVDRTLQATAQNDREKFNQAMGDLLNVCRNINDEMETMWTKSKPADYINFRTFIMGIKNQPMFPKGVIYEGVSESTQQYRGESGANDSIVPTLDNLLELTARMPSNPLTEILKDFRTYRPQGHNAWVDWVEKKARYVGVRKFALSHPDSALLYLCMLDQVREFRHRHWLFTKGYIIAYTSHPVATGGSPIVTWLPNQLGAVLDTMNETCHTLEGLSKSKQLDPVKAALKNDLEKRAVSQRQLLDKEVAELRQKYPNQDKAQVYN